MAGDLSFGFPEYNSDAVREFVVSQNAQVQIARRDFKISPAKLSNVCQVLGIELNHHEALSDARACAQIVMRAVEKLKSEPIELIPPI